TSSRITGIGNAVVVGSKGKLDGRQSNEGSDPLRQSNGSVPSQSLVRPVHGAARGLQLLPDGQAGIGAASSSTERPLGPTLLFPSQFAPCSRQVKMSKRSQPKIMPRPKHGFCGQ